MNSLYIKKFSLIELLIVFALLAILVSLLQPSLTSLLVNGQRLGCANNLRTSGLAIFQYAEDNDDFVGIAWWPGSTRTARYYFNNDEFGRGAGLFHNKAGVGYLDPYMGTEEESHVCPGTDFAQGLEGFTENRKRATYKGFTSYWRMLRRIRDYYVLSDVADSRWGWDKYSLKPLLMDNLFQTRAPFITSGGRWDATGAVIHGNRSNVPILMIDGHVKMFDRTAYLGKSIDESYQPGFLDDVIRD